MKTIPVIASPKKPAPGAKKTHQQQTARPSSASEGSGPEPDSARILLHDAVNQLTIISLACFELNYSAAEFKNEGQRRHRGSRPGCRGSPGAAIDNAQRTERKGNKRALLSANPSGE